MTDTSASAFDASPSDGWSDLFQRFDPTQPAASPSVLEPASPDSSFTNVLLHMAMGGDPDDLSPSDQHIAPHASLLLAALPPVGPGLLGDLSPYAANTQTLAAPSVDSEDDEASDNDDDGDDQEDGQPDSGTSDGPDIAASAATSVGPLDTNAAVPVFTPRPEVARAAAASQRRAMTMAQAQTDLNNPQVQALLAVMRQGESGDRYDAIVNSRQGFKDFSKHPDVSVLISPARPGADGKMTPAQYSTSAGAYQFNKGTWDDTAKVLGLQDFQPASQDLAAAYWLKRLGATDKLAAGDVEGAMNAAGARWQIFPQAGGKAIAAKGQQAHAPAIAPLLKAYKDKRGQLQQ